jgi:hypothetical protein
MPTIKSLVLVVVIESELEPDVPVPVEPLLSRLVTEPSKIVDADAVFVPLTAKTMPIAPLAPEEDKVTVMPDGYAFAATAYQHSISPIPVPPYILPLEVQVREGDDVGGEKVVLPA